jgi:3',5'-cyclic AMP phosphodiesterase CpdA
MRLAVASDMHLGDEPCVLVEEGDDGSPGIGPGYPALRDAVGTVDDLVGLGDVIDVSVATCERAYRDAKLFFTQVQKDGLARELIYVPGNHDFDIWSVVGAEVVIRETGRPVRSVSIRSGDLANVTPITRVPVPVSQA